MRNVPFYANLPEGTHCYQAAFKMMLKYFLPEKKFSWDQLRKLTAKVDGLWTWPNQGLINLNKMDFEIIDMDTFETEKFVRTGSDYLAQKYGREVAEIQSKNSDIKQERGISAKYLALGLHRQQLPTIEDIKKFIDQGFLVMCNVNSRALNNQEGYSGHSVVIFGYDSGNLILHDPGLPPSKNRKAKLAEFSKAWEYPDKDARNLTAIRFKGQK